MSNFTNVINFSTSLPSVTLNYSSKECILNGIDYLVLSLCGVIILIGVVGNAGICFTYGLFKPRKHKTNFETLILYLAISDFLVCVLAPFLEAYWRATCDQKWDFGIFGCKIMLFCRSVLFNTSNGIIILFTMLRYRAVCHPFKTSFENLYIHGSVIVVLVVSVLTEVLYADALTVSVYDASGSVSCLSTTSLNKRAYYQISLVIISIRDSIFLLIFTLSSRTTVKELQNRAVTILELTNSNNNTNNRSESDRRDRSKKVIRSVLILQIIFVLLVIPNDVFRFVYILSWFRGGGLSVHQNLFTYFKVFTKLQIVNSIVNVFVYAKFQRWMKKRIRGLLRKTGFYEKQCDTMVVLNQRRNKNI